MQTQTKPTNGATRATTPDPLNVAPLPAPAHIPSHTPAPAPAAAPETKPAPILEMHEAPYSWNCTAIDPNGFSEMFTVRAVSAEGFYARVAQLKSNLLDLGYKPAPTRGTPASAPAPTATSEPAPICGIHKTPMIKRTGARGTFYSCPQKLDTGEFCPYRPKQ
jgi:hypothetical protein